MDALTIMGETNVHSAGASPRPPLQVIDNPDLDQLLTLARRRGPGDRGKLGAKIADFLLAGTDLSGLERDLVDDILSQLIREIEIEVRRDLAAVLAERKQAPPKLVRMLANDQIEIARPILLSSTILDDEDLLDIANKLSEAHRQAIAGRKEVSPRVTDALVEFGEVDVIVTLLKNAGARFSDDAMAYLVATSKQVEPFREPLLQRKDLPPKLAYRMFWWVSAALRRYLIDAFEVPAKAIDGALARVTAPMNEDTMMARAAHLVRGQGRGAGLGLHDLIAYMQEGRAAMFIAAMAEILVISADTARRLVLDPGGEGLSLICRAAGIPTPMFRRLIESLDENLGQPTRPASAIAALVEAYDGLAIDRAHKTIKFFDQEPVAR